MSTGRPLYPQKRTLISTAAMSALCQKQTSTAGRIGSRSRSLKPKADAIIRRQRAVLLLVVWSRHRYGSGAVQTRMNCAGADDLTGASSK